MAVDGIGVVLHAAHDGEQDGRVARPVLWVGLPEVLTSFAVYDTLELGSLFCDLDSQLFVA